VGLVQILREFLGPLVEEESEELLVKLKLLLQRVLVQSLANLKLLAEGGGGFTSFKNGVSPWPIGDGTLKGLEASG
jgi:hypothetical protein